MMNRSQIISERYDFHSALSRVRIPSVLNPKFSKPAGRVGLVTKPMNLKTKTLTCGAFVT